MKSWLYHPTQGAQIFEGDEDLFAELGEQGWRDTPYGERQTKPKAEPSPPLPDDFATVDEFMTAYVAFEGATSHPDNPKAKEARLKVGLEQYAMTKHKLSLDRRRSVRELHAEVLAADEAAAAEAQG